MALEGDPLVYEIGGERISLSEGEVMLIAPKVEHVRVEDPEAPHFARFSALFRMPVSENYPRDVLAIVQHRHYVKWTCHKILRELVDFILRNMDSQNVASAGELWHCVALFMQMVLDTLRDELGIEKVTGGCRNVNLETDADFCESVVAYMKNHCNELFSIENIAFHFSISPKQLNRRFHAYYGKSCNDIGNRIRRDYAKDLLCNTNLSVEEIANRLGYTNSGNFIRFFKRIEGMSPAAFRRDFHSVHKDHF